MMDLLSGSESDSNNADNSFSINKKYAKSYETWRKKEEKQKLMDKYGDDVNTSSDSEEEEIRSSSVLDKEWLRAYAVVRFNQPRLYSGEKLFNEEVKSVAKKSEEKVTLKDYERKFILEKGGLASEDDENNDFGSQHVGQSYFEEQEEIKNSLKIAIRDLDDVDDKEETLLVKKTKTKEELKQEENEYLAWLKGEKEDLDDKEAAQELAPLKEYWSDPNLTDKEKVLRDYILNNGYMDREESDDEESEGDDTFDFEGEEEFLENADEYEQIYNFRHEEPGGTEIKTYPRVIETSVRAKEDNPRVEKRKRKMEKRQKEKEQRLEDIKILRRLQKEEKEQKLQKLKEASENPDLEYDFDADFDPEEHNKIMKKYFDNNYYQGIDPTKKPIFEPDEALEDGMFGDAEDDWWENRTQAQMEEEEELVNKEEQGNDLYADDPGFVMDADYDPVNAELLKKSKKESKRTKKQKKLDTLPLFDPTTKSFDEYMNDYLKDKINTLPFTYREVVPNDFGLSTQEILSAPDRELNSWVSVKKMSVYRSEQEEKQDIHKFKMKATNFTKKYKILPSLGPKQSDLAGESSQTKKKKRKRKLSEEHGNTDDVSKDKTLQAKDVQEKHWAENPDKIKRQKTKNVKHLTENEVCAVNDFEDLPKNLLKSKKKKIKHQNDDFQEMEKGLAKNIKHQNEGVQEAEKDVTNLKVKKHSKKRKRREDSENKDKDVEVPKDFISPTKGNKNAEDGAKEKMTTKHKKRKLKLKLNDTESTEHKPVTTDKKKAKRDLIKVMSASRLGSYGLGPGTNRNTKKSKKKGKVV